jgi:hypothetical protein
VRCGEAGDRLSDLFKIGRQARAEMVAQIPERRADVGDRVRRLLPALDLARGQRRLQLSNTIDLLLQLAT